MASHIIKGYDEGMIYIDDIEGATDTTRIKNITGMSYDDIAEKVVHRNTGITCESFFENISMIYSQKMKLAKEYGDEFLVHTGKKDFNGNEIISMPPTVYILDSLALLVPENISEEEKLSGQMSTTAAAKTNAKIFRQIVPKLKKANIILIAINHITTKIEIELVS
jgi:RecA/RadA recombinase